MQSPTTILRPQDVVATISGRSSASLILFLLGAVTDPTRTVALLNAYGMDRQIRTIPKIGPDITVDQIERLHNLLVAVIPSISPSTLGASLSNRGRVPNGASTYDFAGFLVRTPGASPTVGASQMFASDAMGAVAAATPGISSVQMHVAISLIVAYGAQLAGYSVPSDLVYSYSEGAASGADHPLFKPCEQNPAAQVMTYSRMLNSFAAATIVTTAPEIGAGEGQKGIYADYNLILKYALEVAEKLRGYISAVLETIHQQRRVLGLTRGLIRGAGKGPAGDLVVPPGFKFLWGARNFHAIECGLIEDDKAPSPIAPDQVTLTAYAAEAEKMKTVFDQHSVPAHTLASYYDCIAVKSSSGNDKALRVKRRRDNRPAEIIVMSVAPREAGPQIHKTPGQKVIGGQGATAAVSSLLDAFRKTYDELVAQSLAGAPGMPTVILDPDISSEEAALVGFHLCTLDYTAYIAEISANSSGATSALSGHTQPSLKIIRARDLPNEFANRVREASDMGLLGAHEVLAVSAMGQGTKSMDDYAKGLSVPSSSIVVGAPLPMPSVARCWTPSALTMEGHKTKLTFVVSNSALRELQVVAVVTIATSIPIGAIAGLSPTQLGSAIVAIDDLPTQFSDFKFADAMAASVTSEMGGDTEYPMVTYDAGYITGTIERVAQGGLTSYANNEAIAARAVLEHIAGEGNNLIAAAANVMAHALGSRVKITIVAVSEFQDAATLEALVKAEESKRLYVAADALKTYQGASLPNLLSMNLGEKGDYEIPFGFTPGAADRLGVKIDGAVINVGSVAKLRSLAYALPGFANSATGARALRGIPTLEGEGNGAYYLGALVSITKWLIDLAARYADFRSFDVSKSTLSRLVEHPEAFHAVASRINGGRR